jgi:hypothetical protein
MARKHVHVGDLAKCVQNSNASAYGLNRFGIWDPGLGWQVHYLVWEQIEYPLFQTKWLSHRLIGMLGVFLNINGSKASVDNKNRSHISSNSASSIIENRYRANWFPSLYGANQMKICDTDPCSLFQPRADDTGIQRSFALFTAGIKGLLGIIGNPSILSDHILGGLPDFVCRGGHVGHLLGLRIGGLGQSVGIGPALMHLPPLQANKQRGEGRHDYSDFSPSQGSPFKASHFAFYLLELVNGFCLCIRSVYWLGHFGRKGQIGFLLLFNGYILA